MKQEDTTVTNRGLGWLKGKAKLPKDYQKWKEKSSKAVMKDMGACQYSLNYSSGNSIVSPEKKGQTSLAGLSNNFPDR